MTGSAKQSRAMGGLLDCFVALLLAMAKERAVGSLALPVADAARLAGPHLDPRVERLRVQGIAVSSRQFGPNRAARFLRVDARFLRTHMRNPGAGNHDPFG